MLATVTNSSRGARGFHTIDRGTVLLEPGASAMLDLSDHPLHRTWVLAGEVAIAALPEKEAKAARRRLDQQSDVEAQTRQHALAALPRHGRPAEGAAASQERTA